MKPIPTDLPAVPAPRILWQGQAARFGMSSTVAVRVVRKWTNSTRDDWKTVTRTAAVIVEEQTGEDAMGQPMWARSSVAPAQLPAEFWEHVFPE